MSPQQLVLIGGGHAHVHLLKKWQDQVLPGTEVTLISADRYQYYSGMFSGYLEGIYSLDDIRIDLLAMCEQAGVTFIEAKAKQIEPHEQLVYVDADSSSHTSDQTSKTGHSNHSSKLFMTRSAIAYDWLSVNIGSGIAHHHVSGVLDQAALIKPNYRLPHFVDNLQQSKRTVVVGGGASGIEMSLSLQAYRKKHQLPPVTLIHGGQLLASYGNRIANRMAAIARQKGLNLMLDTSVSEVKEKRLTLQSGTSVPYDELLWLTGPAAPSLFRESGLPTDRSGYLLVNEKLQSSTYPNIFGAGDCISLASAPSMPKAGVYAVRQAPVLWSNLMESLKQKTTPSNLTSYEPQSSFLSILSTGGGQGLLLYKGISIHSKWCWKLKRYIDTSFMRKYQTSRKA
ncbi:FAD-dependent oxidoreductase [Marinicrinis sediminis]|uniref:FAD-dependent oxidoreductase n=1 Tax=Marinicrinis sediminis TaxID=1652465 RepID=A0ABW5REM4_9BACL